MSSRPVVVLTGGTGGVGRAVVEALSSAYDCVLLYRDERSFEALRRDVAPSIRGVRTDFTDDDAVRRAVDDVAAAAEIHGLLLLAGGFRMGGLAETSPRELRALLEQNLLTAHGVLRHAIPHLRRSGGRVVVVSSEAAQRRDAAIGAYTLTKAALNTLAELLAAELAGTSVTINVIMPTAIGTPDMLANAPADSLVPLSELASTIEFLLSPAAKHVSGSKIVLRR